MWLDTIQTYMHTHIQTYTHTHFILLITIFTNVPKGKKLSLIYFRIEHRFTTFLYISFYHFIENYFCFKVNNLHHIMTSTSTVYKHSPGFQTMPTYSSSNCRFGQIYTKRQNKTKAKSSTIHEMKMKSFFKW